MAAGCCSRSRVLLFSRGRLGSLGTVSLSLGGADGDGMAAGRSVRAARSCLSPLLHLHYPRFHSNRYGPLTLFIHRPLAFELVILRRRGLLGRFFLRLISNVRSLFEVGRGGVVQLYLLGPYLQRRSSKARLLGWGGCFDLKSFPLGCPLRLSEKHEAMREPPAVPPAASQIPSLWLPRPCSGMGN